MKIHKTNYNIILRKILKRVTDITCVARIPLNRDFPTTICLP